MISKSRSRSTKGTYSDIFSIKDLKVSIDEEAQIYPRAYALPQFFTTNLVDEHRIVKTFNSQNAVIQAFAFQFMKLALQIEVQSEKDYIQIAKNIFIRGKDGLIGEDGDLSDQFLTDFQYKKFFKDFIEIVQNQTFPNFQQTAKKYPIIKKILLKLFQKLVPFTLFLKDQQNQIYSDFDIAGQVFQYLSNLFQIQLNLAGDLQCYKFQQSDMFVYVQNLNQIYIAYIDQNSCQEDPFFKSTNSSFVCGQGNSFTSKFKRTKSNKQTTTQNSFKKRKNFLGPINEKQINYKQQNQDQSEISKIKQKQFESLIESKVSQSLPQNLRSYHSDYMNFSIKRRSQNNSSGSSFSCSNQSKNHNNQSQQCDSQNNKFGFENKCFSLSQQNNSNTIIDILESRALQNKLQSSQSIQNNLANHINYSINYEHLTNSQKNNTQKWKQKYKVQQIMQIKQQQEFTQNTINSFNKLNQNPSFLKSFTKSNEKNQILEKKSEQRTSLNDKIVNRAIFKQSSQQWLKKHQKQNLSEFIRPSFKLNFSQQNSHILCSTLPQKNQFVKFSPEIKMYSKKLQNFQNKYPFQAPIEQKKFKIVNEVYKSKQIQYTNINSEPSEQQIISPQTKQLQQIDTTKTLTENNQSWKISTNTLIEEQYKQFTQSRILQLLQPEYRIKIKEIKQKFKQQTKVLKQKQISTKKINFVSVSGSRSKKTTNT